MGDIGSGWYQDAFPPAKKLARLGFDWTGRHVTEIGGNVGEFAGLVLAAGASGYVGSETNADCVAEAQRRRPGLALAHGHAPDVPLGEDVLAVWGVFHHMPDVAVEAVFRRTAARTVCFENPFAAVPGRAYYIRSLEWYLDLAAASGFLHSRVAPYGFAYPADRRLVIVSRDGWDVAERVDLRTRPEYWRALGARVAAIEALVLADDAGPYLDWWAATARKPRQQAEAHLPYLRALVDDLRTRGYVPGAYQASGRDLSWREGHGPISVRRRADGSVTPWDGAHRACILRALDRPVPACVWRGC